MGLNKRLIGAGATASGALTPSENFKVVTYTGDGTTSQFIDVGFTPDFVWIKGRNTSDNHNLIDSSRTAGCFLNSNLTNAEDCNSAHAQIQTNGFNAKSNPNASGINYVAWCWKANGGTTSSNTDGTITSTVQANTDAGFSIIKYTGNNTAGATVGHGLDSTPEFIIFKNYGGVAGWKIFNNYLSNPATQTLELNDPTGQYSPGNLFNSTLPTSSVFSLGNYSDTNASGATMIAYAFHSVENFSKFGSYTGNGSANGPIVETGFEPAFVMIKNITSGGQDWRILDNKRNASNPRNCYLSANNSNAEECQYAQVDFLSNGFQVIGTDGSLNQNSSTMIYMAFAADPDTEAPTLASSFNIETYTGNGSSQSINGLGFEPSLVWLKNRTTTGYEHFWFDSVRNAGPNKSINSDSTNAEGTENTAAYGYLSSFDSDGFALSAGTSSSVTINRSGDSYVAWSWKADDNEPTIFGGSAKAVYKFEDNANDVTGTYNATASNVSYVTGYFNKAAEFNGSNSTMFLASSGNSLVNYDSDFSVSLWFNVSSWATSASTDFLWTGGGTRIINITLKGSTGLDVDIWNSGSNLVSTTGLSENTWHHLVFTRSKSSGMKLYIDGSLVDTNSYTGNAGSLSGKQDSIGTYWDNTRNNFTGKIDQFRIYNGEVSDDDVTTLYAETAAQNDDTTLGGPPETIISANANAGMSIVKWTGTGTQTQIPHGLSAVPALIISKRLDSTNNWSVYHKDLSLSHSTYPNWLYLNLTSSEQNSASSANHPYYARPSATVIYQNTGTSESTNVSGGDYIAYCFHDVTGYQKFGSYTGTGATGNTVSVGFKPDFVMVKSSSAAEPWFILDSKRDTGNPRDNRLMADSSAAEDDGSVHTMDFNSTSFTLNGTLGNGTNGNGQTYIYWAVAKNVPSNTTLANSFKAVTYTGDGGTQSITGLGFKPDLVWIKKKWIHSRTRFSMITIEVQVIKTF